MACVATYGGWVAQRPPLPNHQAEVSSAQQALDLLRRAAKVRQSAGTGINQHSSRSHAIFTVKLLRGGGGNLAAGGGEEGAGGKGGAEGPDNQHKPQQQQQQQQQQPQQAASYLHFVDLAGCERVARTGNSGARLR